MFMSVCLRICVCVPSILDVCSLVDAPASPKEMPSYSAAAVLARQSTRLPPARGLRARADASHGRDVFMSNVEMVSFTFCVRNRKIGYKILRACAWAQTQTQARPRLECSVFCSPFDDDIGGSCCSSCPSCSSSCCCCSYCCCGFHTNLSCACIWSRRKF